MNVRAAWRMVRGVILSVALLLTSALLMSGCGEQPDTPVLWAEGSEQGPWHVVYTGAGTVTKQGRTVTLSPRPSRQTDETHAALVVSTAQYGDLTYRLSMRTRKQLREPDPNPWETAWAVWRYTDNTHFYYLVLKPDGWELGKADPSCPGRQCFLATGRGSYRVQDWHRVEVRQSGATMAVRVNDEPLVTYTDRRGPHPRGSAGFYTEDAEAEYKDISVQE
jgi:hypothetical protein